MMETLTPVRYLFKINYSQIRYVKQIRFPGQWLLN